MLSTARLSVRRFPAYRTEIRVKVPYFLRMFCGGAFLKLGASTKSFGGLTVEATADLFAGAGLDCAELCFCQEEIPGWKYNFCGYRPLPSVRELIKAVNIFADRGISICAIGVYNCLWSGSVSDTAESLKYFSEYCDIARELGIKTVATHSGSLLNRGAKELTEDFKDKMFCHFVAALTEAAGRDITVSVECSFNDVLCNRDEFNLFRGNVRHYFGRSDMLGFTCVPACDLADEDSDISDIKLFHIKDKSRDGRFYERFGEGSADYSVFFGKMPLFSEIPVIFEYINSGNIKETVQSFLQCTENHKI